MTAHSQGSYSWPAGLSPPSFRSALAQCHRESEGTCIGDEGTTPGLVGCSVKEEGTEREDRGKVGRGDMYISLLAVANSHPSPQPMFTTSLPSLVSVHFSACGRKYLLANKYKEMAYKYTTVNVLKLLSSQYYYTVVLQKNARGQCTLHAHQTGIWMLFLLVLQHSSRRECLCL